MRGRTTDLSGRTINCLTVIERHGTCRGQAAWLCRCVCGKEIVLPSEKLHSNDPKRRIQISCGCKHVRINAKSNLRKAIHEYRTSARRKSVSWLLTDEQALEFFKKDCFYCGARPSITVNSGKGDVLIRNGIDRKDSSLGYTMDNCVPCCSRCNYLKSNINFDDFITAINEIHKHLSEK